jgi:hypothetical protein
MRAPLAGRAMDRKTHPTNCKPPTANHTSGLSRYLIGTTYAEPFAAGKEPHPTPTRLPTNQPTNHQPLTNHLQIHTPESSRYWIGITYAEPFAAARSPTQHPPTFQPTTNHYPTTCRSTRPTRRATGSAPRTPTASPRAGSRRTSTRSSCACGSASGATRTRTTCCPRRPRCVGGEGAPSFLLSVLDENKVNRCLGLLPPSSLLFSRSACCSLSKSSSCWDRGAVAQGHRHVVSVPVIPRAVRPVQGRGAARGAQGVCGGKEPPPSCFRF